MSLNICHYILKNYTIIYNLIIYYIKYIGMTMLRSSALPINTLVIFIMHDLNSALF